MRRWLQRFAGLRRWRWRRDCLDLAARCEVLAARGEADPGCADLAVAIDTALRRQLPHVRSAQVALVTEDGERVSFLLSARA